MSNRFFSKDDITSSASSTWRARVAEELRRRSIFADLHVAAVYSAPEIYIYHKEDFRPYGAKLAMQMGDEGLGVGFYIERGYLWAAEAGWTLQPHWDWHHFLHLLSSSPEFMLLFKQARERSPDFAVWIQSGEADPEELSLFATHLPFATILSILQNWPGQLWCDFYFSTHLSGDQLLALDDDAVISLIQNALSAVEPIYRAVLERKRAIEQRTLRAQG